MATLKKLRSYWRRLRGRCPNCNRAFGNEHQIDGQPYCIDCACTYGQAYTQCGEVWPWDGASWV